MKKEKVVLDARGAKIEKGAIVIWHSTYPAYSGVYTVQDVKTRVKIDEYTWVNTDRVFVVDSVPEPYRQEQER